VNPDFLRIVLCEFRGRFMSIRDQFPILEHTNYLASCSHGALSVQVRKAYEHYLNDRETYGAHWDYWVEQLETTRDTLAELVGCNSDELAVTPSVSNAVSSLASGIDFSGERNKIVCTEFDFPTTGQIWRAHEQRGAEVVYIAASEDGTRIPYEHFKQVIDETTAVVSIPHVCYRNGAKLDIKPIIELARSRGALVVLDSYQTLGTMPINVVDLNVDVLLGGAQKYLLGSSGTGFMYVRKDVIQQLRPTTSGWFCQDNISAMDIYANQPSLTARRFEGGTPNVPNLYAVIAGINLIRSIGLEKIEAHNALLLDAFKEGIKQRGFTLATNSDGRYHGAMIAIKSTDMSKLVGMLSRDRIITSCRDGNLRVSVHIYNNLTDIDQLLNALTKHKHLLI
jgi:selenocysteine lyase/cysteine desulfurase|tara:strand:- start:58 stop:1242 length:1185 start_codon:yes stop_codon:yes gene_type:complete